MKKPLAWILSHLTLLYRLIAIGVTVVLILLMFPNTNRSTHYDYSVGGFWRDGDLYAPFDFTVELPLTPEEEHTAHAQAIRYYQEDTTAYVLARHRVESLIPDRVRRIRMLAVVDDIYRKGYLEVPEAYIAESAFPLVLLSGNVGRVCNSTDFVGSHDLYDYILRQFPDPTQAEQLEELLRDSILSYSIRYDITRSRLEYESRLAQIHASSESYTGGQLVIAKGEHITPEKAAAIASLEAENKLRFEAHYNPTNHYIGQFLLGIIAFSALFMFLKTTRHEILEDNRKVTFTLVTILLMAGITSFLVHLAPDWVLLAPLCIAPIIMRIFFDMRVALYIHLTTVIILGNLVPNSYEFIFYQLITGMMSIITVRNFERRSNFFVVSLVIFLTYSVIYTAGKLSQDTSLAGINYQRYLMFFGNATLTLLAYPLIYLFEKLFGITTALTLLEISSTNTPALRELSRRAPGTFQHCMQVANISEDVVNEIGGNALLARVGALYHDIGKTEAPLYFTENQNSNFNPHDNLDPEESARIITQHVRDGVELARHYHLPACVVDFIRTHHGTTKTGYFFAQWKKTHDDTSSIPSVFQYAGPKPFSIETAVVMIVDSVEAACRSLSHPDKENLSRLIDSLIDSKIQSEQLSNCDITFADIEHIREILKSRMMSIYHVRIAYPVVEDQTDNTAHN